MNTTRRYRPRLGAPEVQRALTAYCSRLEAEGRSERTARLYAGHLRRFIEWCGDDRRLSRTRLEAYCDLLTDAGASASHRRAVRSALRYFIRWTRPVPFRREGATIYAGPWHGRRVEIRDFRGGLEA